MKLKEFEDRWDRSSKAPVYVGVDQSYSGFAITLLREDGTSLTTVYKAEGLGVKRLYSIQEHLIKTLVQQSAILDVAMEGYAFGSQMANMLGELGGAVKLALYFLGHCPLVVPPTSLKKYVTGKGQGIPKSQMVLHVYKQWGVEFSDDNAADSYALARLVSGYSKYEYQKEICAKLSDPKFRDEDNND